METRVLQGVANKYRIVPALSIYHRYMCVYVCMSMYIYIYMWIYICIYMYKYTHIYIYI